MIKLISRESTLALAQSLAVAEKLLKKLRLSSKELQINVHKTIGDIELEKPLYEVKENNANLPMQPKSLFTSELEEIIASGAADLAVHSLKDLQTDLAADCQLLDVLLPEIDHDILILKIKSWKGI